MRTEYCGQLRLSHVGQQVTLCGWVNRRRDLGSLIFIDMRDREGIVQVFFDPDRADALKLASELRNEFCIQVTGTVRARDEKNINRDMATGEIEVLASSLTIINRADVLPLDSNHVNTEEARLKYRYLDLRRPEMAQRLKTRAKITSLVRRFMDDHGFLDIETPMLTKATPEGARDYLVPSRVHKGKFYALPQSPQLFKQLLMMSGFDRYYQIVKCFRDEDLRADRQPEFTQIDVETSFMTAPQVREVMEALVRHLWLEVKGVDLGDFPVMTFAEAERRYGSDKPDLRNPLRIIDVTDFFQKCTFKPFIGKTVRAIRVHANMSKGFHEKLLKFATGLGMGGLGYLEVLEDGSYKGPIDKFIPDDCKEEFRTLAGLEVGDTIFFMADKEERAAYYAGMIRNELGEKLDLIEKNAYRFCYVNDFPMFEKDPETKKIGFTHNPFSMPQGGLEALNTMDPLDILAYQYDIVCNGVELSSGAVRNHDMQIMEKAFEIAGYDKEVLKNKFGALYTAFQYGAPPHAGMAPGVDRMIMLLRNEENIREVIAFPMNGNAQDLMCGAPNEVTEQQLREVHIKVRD